MDSYYAVISDATSIRDIFHSRGKKHSRCVRATLYRPEFSIAEDIAHKSPPPRRELHTNAREKSFLIYRHTQSFHTFSPPLLPSPTLAIGANFTFLHARARKEIFEIFRDRPLKFKCKWKRRRSARSVNREYRVTQRQTRFVYVDALSILLSAGGGIVEDVDTRVAAGGARATSLMHFAAHAPVVEARLRSSLSSLLLLHHLRRRLGKGITQDSVTFTHLWNIDFRGGVGRRCRRREIIHVFVPRRGMPKGCPRQSHEGCVAGRAR